MNGTTAWFAAVALTAASSAANAFRVTPYVQHPATNAMTLMWLMQEDGPGAVAWREIGGAGAGSGTTTPRLAGELSYLYGNLKMLNVAATNAAAGGTITIEGIEVVGDDVKVTVFIDRAMSLGAEITGTLKLLGATTLEGGFAEIGAQEITIGADQDGTPNNIKKVITYPMAGGKKFYKSVIAPKS
jgi:hypothetical protein